MDSRKAASRQAELRLATPIRTRSAWGGVQEYQKTHFNSLLELIATDL